MAIFRMYLSRLLLVYASLAGNAFAATSFSTQKSSVKLGCKSPVPNYEFHLQDGHSPANTFLAMLAATVAENWTDASIRKDLESWGFSDIFLIGKPWLGAYGYIAEMDDFRILAFRGTHSIPEGLVDAAAVTVPYADIGFPGRGHAGMKTSFKLLWPQYSNELIQREGVRHKPLLVVGHSLGGTLAILNAARLIESGFDVHSVYTLAQPRIGNASLTGRIQDLLGDRLYRLENDKDPVPHLPPTAGNAELFAEVFTTPGSRFHETLVQTIQNLDYAPLPGRALEMTPRGFETKLDFISEQRSEAEFIRGYKDEVVGSNTDAGVAMQLAKRVKSHFGDTYICKYLELIEAGHSPQFL